MCFSSRLEMQNSLLAQVFLCTVFSACSGYFAYVHITFIVLLVGILLTLVKYRKLAHLSILASPFKINSTTFHILLDGHDAVLLSSFQPPNITYETQKERDDCSISPCFWWLSFFLPSWFCSILSFLLSALFRENFL